MLKVEFGSIFDTKSDLLVVPCDSAGGVTNAVFNNLKSHGLPTRIGAITYGEVHYRESSYEFANTVGYAASVNHKYVNSDPSAITNIASSIARYCDDNQLGLVNIPLLGSGAGGLSPVTSFKALEKGFNESKGTIFNIFCLTREAYLNTRSLTSINEQKNNITSPRVFISYAQNDQKNVEWVKELVKCLRNSGINARVDIYHLTPGIDLPQWMANEVVLANKVILICDRHYVEKADGRKGGVGWETMLIQGDMLTQGDNKNKYIAVVRNGDFDKTIPLYMKSKYALISTR